MASDLQVVLGAHGSAGSALVRELRQRGAPVRAVSRRPVDPDETDEFVEWVAGDAASSDDRSRIYANAGVVYLAAQPLYARWAQDFPLLVEGVLAGVSWAGSRLVHVDNAYMYGQVDGELTESLPYQSASRKGRVRAQIADRLMSAHARGEAAVTIGRGSDFFGPNVGGSTAGDSLFADVIDNKVPRWLGALDVPHSLSYIDDVARALVTLGASDRALGEVWHLPAAPAVTGREFLTMACTIANRPVQIGVHGRLAMTVAGWFSALVSEVKEELYQFQQPWVLNAMKYQRVFGPFEPTPMEDAIRRTIDWYREAWSDQRSESA
ncbi:MAG: NAD-dependent epimerase/dehydratase family protein [Gemmatimonadaceae bacterium]